MADYFDAVFADFVVFGHVSQHLEETISGYVELPVNSFPLLFRHSELLQINLTDP